MLLGSSIRKYPSDVVYSRCLGNEGGSCSCNHCCILHFSSRFWLDHTLNTLCRVVQRWVAMKRLLKNSHDESSLRNHIICHFFYVKNIQCSFNHCTIALSSTFFYDLHLTTSGENCSLQSSSGAKSSSLHQKWGGFFNIQTAVTKRLWICQLILGQLWSSYFRWWYNWGGRLGYNAGTKMGFLRLYLELVGRYGLKAEGWEGSW